MSTLLEMFFPSAATKIATLQTENNELKNNLKSNIIANNELHAVIQDLTKKNKKLEEQIVDLEAKLCKCMPNVSDDTPKMVVEKEVVKTPKKSYSKYKKPVNNKNGR
jgi:predicted  nucleic acid-binding Zn-ribbon protein